MASYPNAVKSFTTRNAGDTIQPADVNDLQDEVNAIEAGLLNGTAQLNSSHTTCATMSVTGGSTLTGNVQMAGNCTIAGNLVVSGSFSASSATFTVDSQPRVRLFHGSTQTIPTATETAATFNSEDFDPQGLHSTGSNPTRINLTSTGLWMFGATVFIAGQTGDTYIRLRKNGATAIGSAVGLSTIAGIAVRAHLTEIDVITSSNDYMEVLMFQNSGFNVQSGNASSRIDQNEFWAAKLW